MHRFVVSNLVVLSLLVGLGFAGASVLAETDSERTEEVNSLAERIKQDPKNWKLYARRGTDLSFLQRPDEAIVDLRKANELNPDWAGGYVLVGTCLEDKKDYLGAISFLNKALSINDCSKRDLVYTSKSLCLYRIGNYRDSYSVAKDALSINPNNADASFFGSLLIEQASRF